MTKAKHVFDSGKTSSYHLKSVAACQQSSKNSSTFKLVVHSGADRNKRYEFEAESAKLAGAGCRSRSELFVVADLGL